MPKTKQNLFIPTSGLPHKTRDIFINKTTKSRKKKLKPPQKCSQPTPPPLQQNPNLMIPLGTWAWGSSSSKPKKTNHLKTETCTHPNPFSPNSKHKHKHKTQVRETQPPKKGKKKKNIPPRDRRNQNKLWSAPTTYIHRTYHISSGASSPVVSSTPPLLSSISWLLFLPYLSVELDVVVVASLSVAASCWQCFWSSAKAREGRETAARAEEEEEEERGIFSSFFP